MACMKAGIIRESQFIRPTKPIDGPGPCGADLPLKVAAFPNDSQSVALALASTTGTQSAGFATGLVEMTVIRPEATLGCPMVAWTDDWITTAVQPAAIAWFGQGIREIRTAGSYACRRRNHQANARLSEHAFGNAIDIMSFVFNDGNVVTVKGGWRGSEQEQGFLRDVFHGACQRFKTVLGPGSDALHYDHFHLDLARHDARGQRRYCKPQVAAPQRPLPGSFGPGVSPFGGPPNPYAYRQDAPYPAGTLQGQTQIANGPRPPGALQAPALSANALPPPGSGMLPGSRSPAPAGGRWQDGQGQDFELEPDFDPAQFDLATGSIPDLPPRRVPGLPPERTGSLAAEPAETEIIPAPKPRPHASAPSRQPIPMSNPRGN